MHTPIFWTFIAGRALCTAWGTGLIFHQISLFENLGHTPLKAAEIFGYAALVTAGSTLFTGWLVDRLRPNSIMALQLGGLMAANGLATSMTPAALVLMYALAFGFFMGIGSVFDGTVWATLFGRKHQGTIRGFVATALVAGTSIGPITFGLPMTSLAVITWRSGQVLFWQLSLVSLVLAAPQPQRAG